MRSHRLITALVAVAIAFARDDPDHADVYEYDASGAVHQLEAHP